MKRVNSCLSLWAILLWFSTNDSIAQWQQLDVNNAGNLLDVAYATPEKAWACGQSGVYGLMIRSIDGGKSWIGERHGAPISRINRLQMIDTLTGFAVGDRGLILKRGWVPGTVGIQWHVLPELSQDNLTTVSFVDANVGWIASGRGRVWKTSDGGSSWSEQQQENQEFSVIYDMFFLDTLNGWTAGFHPSKTTDGGLSWSRMTLPLEQEWRGVHFVNRNVGFLVGTTGGLLRTTNGGSSWTRIWSTTGVMLMSVDFVNEQEGYIVGGGINDGAWIDSSRVLRTTDAGLTWAQEPHPTDVWLNQIDVYDEDHVLAVGGKSIMIQRATIVTVDDESAVPPSVKCEHHTEQTYDMLGRIIPADQSGPTYRMCQSCGATRCVLLVR
jgi:photosystem II stability/assembly factor-like uncharacterized protein